MARYKFLRLVSLVLVILLFNGFVQSEPQSAFGQSLQGFDCATVIQIPIEECSALVALYNSTGGPSWTHQGGWLQTKAPCAWYGVYCYNVHVTQLFLYDNQLSGTIPPELGNLTNLYDLLLSGNQLSGVIPPQLGNLTNLQELWLDRNQLSGTIPLNLANLSNLEHLGLEYNQLSGVIPPQLANLTNLTSLNLFGNQLSGAIPPQLANLSNLEHLGLEYNQLSGAIPPQLANLANLKYLGLSNNQLSGAIPPQLANLTNLREMWLDHNLLSGSVPPQLASLTNLGGLWLSNNQLSGPIPSQLANLANLQGLGLSNNQFSGNIPPELGNLSNLQWLYLSDNQLSGSIPPQLANLVNLQFLYLANSQLHGVIPQTFTRLQNLDYFYFNNTQLCEPPYPVFQEWIDGVPYVQSTNVLCTSKVALLVHGWQGLSTTGYKCSDWNVQTMEYSPTDNPDVTEMQNVARELYGQGYRVFAARWTTRLGYDISIEDASECLRDQIEDVTDLAGSPEKVVLVAHSMGGLVSRAYVERLRYRGDVSHLITIGTPHGGINSLNFFRLFARLLANVVICDDTNGDSQQPGTCQLRSDYMRGYNYWYQPNPAIPYDVIGGDSNPGFLAPIAGIGDGNNDGFIGAYSSNGYYGPRGRITAIYGSNVHRWRTQGSHHEWFGHPTYFEDPATIDCLNHILNNSPANNCDSPPSQELLQGDGTPLATSPIYSGTITNGSTYTLPVTIDGGNTQFITSWNTANLTYHLRTPSGTLITPATVGAIGGTYESSPATEWGATAAYLIPNPQEGTWQAILTFINVEPPALYTFWAMMESDIQIESEIPASVVQGTAFTVGTILTNNGTPLSGAQVQANLNDGTTKQTITLNETQPGHYEGTLTAPPVNTIYPLRITASGNTPIPYARETIETLVVRENFVTVNGTPTEQGIDTNGNGLFEALRITVPLQSTVTGSHVISLLLMDEEGLAIAETNRVTDLVVGNQVLSLDFEGGDILVAGRDGPYTVALQVVSNDPISLVGEDNPLLVTRDHAASDFEASGPSQLYLPLLRRD